MIKCYLLATKWNHEMNTNLSQLHDNLHFIIPFKYIQYKAILIKFSLY